LCQLIKTEPFIINPKLIIMKNVTKRTLVLLVMTIALGTFQKVWSQNLAADQDISGIITAPGSYSTDSPMLPLSVLFDNGPVYNSTGTGAGGANESVYYQGGTGTYGSGCQFASGIYLADDFTVPNGKTWSINSIDFYSYQTNSTTTSTFTGIYLRIWNGKPGVAGSAVIWGDMTTNLMINSNFENIYRVLTVAGGVARPIMKVEARTIGLLLYPGSYWAEYGCTGSLASGPWSAPVVTTEFITGNAIQTTDAGVTYSDVLYNTYAQGMPFTINGNEIPGILYYNYNTNGSNNSFPFNIATGKDVQLLYLPGDFTQPTPAPAGSISSLSIRIGDAFPLGPWTYTDLTIKMGQSAINSFPAGAFYSPLTTVYYKPSITLEGAPGGWMTIPLDTPFAYDPAQSLIVDVGQCEAPGATGFSACFTYLTDNRRIWSVGGCPFVYSSTNTAVFHVGVTVCIPATIQGNADACVNGGIYDYTTEVGMTGYTWTVSPGNLITGGQGTNQVQVTWAAPGVQWVAVNYNSAGGCSSDAVFNVNVNPGPVPTIDGPASLCANSIGNVYTTEYGMTGYVWTVSPGNEITSGQGTNHAEVTWAVPGAQWITVNYTGTNGCSASVPTLFNVTVNPSPVPTLNGPTSVCAASTGNVYTTQAGMTNYDWLVSSGGTITNGGTTTSNTATITWNTAGAQLVYINYTNAEGCHAPVPTILNVAVKPIPVTPVITLSGNVLNSDAFLGNQWYLNSAIIPGATAQYYTAVYSGDYFDIVTLDGCSSQMSNIIAVVVTQIDNTEPAQQVSIFPNPSNGIFTLSFNPGTIELSDLRILNNLGISVYEKEALKVDGTLKMIIDLSSLPRGVYSVVLNTESQQIVHKIVIN
jgi:hypothetical protein